LIPREWKLTWKKNSGAHVTKMMSKETEQLSAELRSSLDMTSSGNVLLPDALTSDLDKVHFVIGNGILRPGLR